MSEQEMVEQLIRENVGIVACDGSASGAVADALVKMFRNLMIDSEFKLEVSINENDGDVELDGIVSKGRRILIAIGPEHINYSALFDGGGASGSIQSSPALYHALHQLALAHCSAVKS